MQHLTPATGMSVSRFDLGTRNAEEGLQNGGLNEIAVALSAQTPELKENYTYEMTEGYVPPQPRM